MSIEIKNCSTNNLKNISIKIPVNKITCICGPSGSGKSSLAFHTLANESKRRFLNSMPSSLTFFDRVPQSAVVDKIEPVLPVWVLEQSNPIVGSRLVVADQLELTNDSAKLFFESAHNHCPIHQHEMSSTDFMMVEDLRENVSDGDVLNFFIAKDLYLENIKGYPVRSLGADQTVSDFNEMDEYWEIFRLKGKGLDKLIKRLEEFPFIKGQEQTILVHVNGETKFFRLSNKMTCLSCVKEEIKTPRSLDEMIPFNGVGACFECKGYGSVLNYSRAKMAKFPFNSINEGAISILDYSKFSHYKAAAIREIKKAGYDLSRPFHEIEDDELWDLLDDGAGNFPGLSYLLEVLELKRYKRSVRIYLRSIQSDETCPKCDGTRVSVSTARCFSKDFDLNYGEFLELSLQEAQALLSSKKSKRLKVPQKHLLEKINIAVELGLGELNLTDKLKELDPNEYQKSLLVRYLSYQGTGSLFILDEPALGLDLDAKKMLMKKLKELSQDNTIVVVDHSDYIQSKSDHIIKMGPGAGHLGGEVTYVGKYKKEKSDLDIDDLEIPKGQGKLTLKGISFADKVIDKLSFKLNTLNVLTSKRTSVANKFLFDVLANDLTLYLTGKKLNYDIDYSIDEYLDDHDFDDVVVYHSGVDRASGRSTVGTMLGLSAHVRKYYASIPVSKNLGLKDGHFSPNSELGQCRTCEGKGVVNFDMQFMEDMIFPCEDCDGKKLNKFYANITDGNFTVYEAYNTPILELYEKLPQTPKVKRLLEYLKVLNLQYLTLDRTLPSLSGGERMRVRFLNTLQKDMSNSLLIFTGLSNGLSHVELAKMQDLLIQLCHKGNTIIAVDNHPMFHKFNTIHIN
jgi:excinuclease ABC subunit A